MTPSQAAKVIVNRYKLLASSAPDIAALIARCVEAERERAKLAEAET